MEGKREGERERDIHTYIHAYIQIGRKKKGDEDIRGKFKKSLP